MVFQDYSISALLLIILVKAMAMWCGSRYFDNFTEAFFHVTPPKLNFVQQLAVTLYSMFVFLFNIWHKDTTGHHILDDLSFWLCSFCYYLEDSLALGEGGKFMSACITKHDLWNVEKIYIGSPLKWKEFTMIENIWNLSKGKFLCQLLWCVSQASTSGCRENALLSCIKLVLTRHQLFDLNQQH